jgi:hypothetical protein
MVQNTHSFHEILSRLSGAVALLMCIQEVSGSCLGLDTGYCLQGFV